ncbi:SCP2 sterol-binding domain-containing protein [Brevibacillus sp. SYSU BS000544]|uniref:SCP2 sterol-binding domain-containing protein n=1 Tax=Brevibacillus sp. SYSU BS000544 TaxID=3416443 RepID=UPI003CE50893
MVDQVLAELAEKINNNPAGIQGFNAVFTFDLSGEQGGVYQVKFQDNTVQYQKEALGNSKCTLILSDSNFVKLIKGDLNPTTAFMMGKLKVKGDLSLSLKLQAVLKNYQ